MFRVIVGFGKKAEPPFLSFLPEFSFRVSADVMYSRNKYYISFREKFVYNCKGKSVNSHLAELTMHIAIIFRVVTDMPDAFINTVYKLKTQPLLLIFIPYKAIDILFMRQLVQFMRECHFFCSRLAYQWLPAVFLPMCK